MGWNLRAAAPEHNVGRAAESLHLLAFKTCCAVYRIAWRGMMRDSTNCVSRYFMGRFGVRIVKIMNYLFGSHVTFSYVNNSE